MALTERKKRFAQEYVVDLVASAAAIRAGYSARRARQTAFDILSDPAVEAYVQELQAEKAKRCEITADRVLAEYAKLAFLDPRRFFDDSGNLLPVHELPPDVAAALAGMDVVTERVGYDEEGKPLFAAVRKIKLTDKRAALDSIARHLGMFKDKLEVSLDESLAERIQRAKERANAPD